MNQRTINGLNTEIRQIPAALLKRWQTTHRIQTTPIAFLQRCAKNLLTTPLAQPQDTQNWLRQLNIPDSYSTLQRALGLYPLAIIPFRWGVINEQHGLNEQWG